MTQEDIELCKRLQERAAACYKYYKLYPTVFKVVAPVAAALYAEDRWIRGVELDD